MALPNNPTPAELVKEVKALNTNKMDKADPTGTGSLSLNRKANTTIGTKSVAVGYNPTASGFDAFAEGENTTASGNYSHSEGASTIASGECAHSGGKFTQANGDFSRSDGYATTAQRKSQHVFGEYNVADTTGADGTVKGDYIEIVGNGTAVNARSNARTLDWSGNETLAGWMNMNGSVPAVGYDSSGTSTAEQTLLDNYYTKTQVDNLDNQKEDKFDYVTLWTNSDVTQSLAGLDVPLTNLSQYRGFVLHYRRAKDYDIVYNQTIIIPPTQRSGGVNFNLIGIFGYLTYCRNCEINYTNNKFIIKTAYKQTSFGGGSSDADKLIPMTLIGIK